MGMKQFGNKLLTPSEIDEAYKIYSIGGFSLNKISIAYGFGKHGRALSRAFKEQGYKLRGGKSLSENQEDKAVKMYQDGMSASQVGQELGVSTDIIFYLLEKRNDVEARKHTSTYKYKVNEHAFDTIDSELAAYWLGFLYADGFTARDKILAITLSQKDIDHLEKLKVFLQSNYKIYKSIHTGFGVKGKKATLMITRSHLAQTLIQKGIVKNRTKFQDTLQAIHLGFENHFIRGYLDGDGCIRGAYNPSVTFVGQLDILEWIRETFHKHIGTNPNLSIPKGKGIYSINYCGNRQARTITTWLYKNATVWMERKRAKLDTWP